MGTDYNFIYNYILMFLLFGSDKNIPSLRIVIFFVNPI